MGLSSELISQFVKITNDREKKPKETTVYGTVKFMDDKPFVQLDGSSILTPVSTTSTVRDGNRVTVLIKNHSAIITGNVSAPSASSEMLTDLAEDLGLVGDDLAGITSDFDLLVQTVSEINDDLVETGQDVVALENLTSGITKKSNGNYSLNGFEVGANKVLWTGGSYMTDDQSITLPEPVSKQKNGIVVSFCMYSNGNPSNTDWCSYFIPKQLVTLNPGRGHSFIQIAGADFWSVGAKHLFIYDDKIIGYVKNANTGSNAASGITFKNNEWVLRYIFGV